MEPSAARQRKAGRGTKMIEVTAYFWTDGMPDKKHCEAKGVLRLVANPLHGIKSRRMVHFQSLPDLVGKLERLFTEGGITVHTSQRERKYRAR
jgi:hypothetical protein